ncbi:MAG: hypothetical protein RLZZ292_2761 [Bacteroidota bacterium]|jgi:RHS repeat-associated protein
MYRGYTGHEHLARRDNWFLPVLLELESCVSTGICQATLFDLINMNGRLYDPTMGRMLSVDNIYHDGAGSQGYNGYTYAFNNPLRFTDPDGENPLLIGAAIGVVMNGIGNLQNGVSFWQGAGRAAFMGAFQGLAAFSIGTALAGKHVAQAIAHGLLGGISSAGSGGKFVAGFASGAISSLVGSGVGLAANKWHLTDLEGQAAIALAGSVTGGISSKLSGGTFIDGFKNGLITAGLNHAMHWTANYLSQPETKKLEVIIWKEDGSVGHLAIRIDDKVYGYYPTDINNDGRYTLTDLYNSPGEMKILDYNSSFKQAYKDETVDVFGMVSSNDQIFQIEGHLKWVTENSGFYELTGSNCTSVGVQSLQSGKIYIRNQNAEIMSGYSTKPSTIQNLLQTYNQNLFYYHHKNVIIR